MAIKKAQIPFSKLVPIYQNGDWYYLFNYKITSENKNRTSETTPVIKIKVPKAYDPSSSVAIFNTEILPQMSTTTLTDGTLYSLYWDAPTELADFPEFDVFIRWKYPSGVSYMWTDWEYLNTQPMGPITVINNSGTAYTELEISVQLASYPKQPVIITNLPATTLFHNDDDLNRHLEIFTTTVLI